MKATWNSRFWCLLMILASLVLLASPARVWAGGPAPLAPAPVQQPPAPQVPPAAQLPPPAQAAPVAPVSPLAPPAAVMPPPDPRLPGQVELRYATNLRSGPGVRFGVVRAALPGERFVVLACNEACDWYRVETEVAETEVWVAAFLVVPVPGTAAIEVEIDATLAVQPPGVIEIAPGAAVATGSSPIMIAPAPAIAVSAAVNATVRVNTQIYRGPGTAYPVSDVIAQGQPIAVVGRNSLGNWYVLVSGDWIAASAVLNAPPALPIAWEPPPPPGGPEREGVAPPPVVAVPVAAPGGVPAAPQPGITAPAPTTQLSADDINYLNRLQIALNLYTVGAQQLAQQFDEVSQNPLIFLDAGWRARVQVTINDIRQANQTVRSLTPSPRYSAVHVQLVLVANTLDTAFTLIVQGIDEVDANKVEQGIALIAEATAVLNQARQQIQSGQQIFPDK